MTKVPEFVFVSMSKATTYRFQVMQPLGGWALCTVNDTTGELSIQSDWEHWAYRWNTEHLGKPSLTTFIATSYVDYLANKLMKDRTRFDAPGTVACFRRMLAEARLEQGRLQGRLSAETAREIWDDLGELSDCEDANLFLERFYNISGHNWVSDCAHEDLVHVETFAYRVLRDGILPALSAVCRGVTAT